MQAAPCPLDRTFASCRTSEKVSVERTPLQYSRYAGAMNVFIAQNISGPPAIATALSTSSPATTSCRAAPRRCTN
jgi:hypothetical protein